MEQKYNLELKKQLATELSESAEFALSSGFSDDHMSGGIECDQCGEKQQNLTWSEEMNNEPTVRIKITGAAGSGKTTIMNILALALKKNGIRFECEDDIGRGVRSEGWKVTQFTKPIKRDYDQKRLVRITTREELK